MGTQLILKFHGFSKFNQCGNIFLETEVNQKFDHDCLITLKRRNFLCYQVGQDNIFEIYFDFILPRYPTSPTHRHTQNTCPWKSFLSRFLFWDYIPSVSTQMLKFCGHPRLPFSRLPKIPPSDLPLHCCCPISVQPLGAPLGTKETVSC